MSIGENLKKYRKMERMTQADLAKRAGIALSTYQRYERGERSPNVETLEAIRKALGIAPSALEDTDLLPEQYLKNQRLTLAITPEEAASRAGIDAGLYKSYESGETEMDAETYYDIMMALGVPNDEVPAFVQMADVSPADEEDPVINKIVDGLRHLNGDGRQKILELVSDFCLIRKYQYRVKHEIRIRKIDPNPITEDKDNENEGAPNEN